MRNVGPALARLATAVVLILLIILEIRGPRWARNALYENRVQRLAQVAGIASFGVMAIVVGTLTTLGVGDIRFTVIIIHWAFVALCALVIVAAEVFRKWRS